MRAPEKISITIDNKILLHILALGHLDESGEIPITLTQSGIANAINTPLGSVSRALKKLIDSGLLVEKLYHIRGKKRRQIAYFLTLSGEEHILKFSDKLASKIIKVKDEDGNIDFIPISQVMQKIGKKVKMIDIVNHFTKYEYVELKTISQQLKEKSEKGPEKGFLIKHLERMPKIRQFYDRTKELNYLYKNMKLSSVIVIHGIAGIGKSTLAAKFIERYVDSRNIFWYRFQEWDSVRNILVPIGNFLADMDRKKLKYYLDSTPNIDYFDVINILKTDLNQSNTIIVFDDFQRVGDRIIQFFSSLAEHLEDIDNFFMLVLSRSLMRFYNRRDVSLRNLIKELRLEGLDREGSRQLVKPKALDKASFDKLYKLTNGHPLALELIESADDLKYSTRDIMRFVHEEIFSKLTPEEKDLLKAISIYRGPIHSDAIFLEDSFEFETMDNLIEKAILVEVKSNVYEVHDIISEFFYTRISPKKRAEYHRKAAKYYNQLGHELSFVETAYHMIHSNNQDEAAQLIIEHAPTVIDKGYHEEVMNIILSFDHNLKTEYLSQIYKIKGQILDIWGEWNNIFEYYYQCYTLSNYLNEYIPFKLDRSKLHETVGYMSWKPLEVNTALKNLKSSLKIVKEVKDQVGINEINRSIAWVYWLKGEYDNAIEFYNKSLKEVTKLPIDSKHIEANILINLGNIYWEKSKWKKAIEYFDKSIKIFKDIKNNYKIAQIFNNIGCVHGENGDIDKAMNFFNKGISLSEEIYYIRGKAYTLLHSGESQIRQGDFQAAQKSLEKALDIFSKIEDSLGIIYTKINYGIIHLKENNWEKAKDYFLSSVDILTELDAEFYLAEIYLGLSMIFTKLNNMEMANEFKRNAESIF
jgi:ATP/maltotriose-dependent transcriptional regulator MalT/DNA-binding MarR family transcriptional regulator